MDTLERIVVEKDAAFHDDEALARLKKLPIGQLYFHAQETAEKSLQAGTEKYRRMRALAEYEIARRQRVALTRLTLVSTVVSAAIGAGAAVAGAIIGASWPWTPPPA